MRYPVPDIMETVRWSSHLHTDDSPDAEDSP